MVKRDDMHMQIEMAFPHVALNYLNAPLWGNLKTQEVQRSWM